ncbi:hypothetical protein C7M84_000348 [Penaeus vannamei]|uniref:Uncharacterized protein n=1 Tax=Penaeus vannamei TaxID=6689 RepID=A0A3R7N9J0_PENVA|nr:hypothetical protein C7M84_000348 [Penaeus vannamei]
MPPATNLTRERVKKQPKTPSSPPAKPPADPAPEVKLQQEDDPPSPEVASVEDAKGANRYVSTLVWVPRMHPEKFSTTLIVSPEEATFTDAIYIKDASCDSHGNKDEARKQ